MFVTLNEGLCIAAALHMICMLHDLWLAEFNVRRSQLPAESLPVAPRDRAKSFTYFCSGQHEKLQQVRYFRSSSRPIVQKAGDPGSDVSSERSLSGSGVEDRVWQHEAAHPQSTELTCAGGGASWLPPAPPGTGLGSRPCPGGMEKPGSGPGLTRPPRPQATEVRINPVEFNPDFVARMIPKVEWAALLEAADTVSTGPRGPCLGRGATPHRPQPCVRPRVGRVSRPGTI